MALLVMDTSTPHHIQVTMNDAKAHLEVHIVMLKVVPRNLVHLIRALLNATLNPTPDL